MKTYISLFFSLLLILGLTTTVMAAAVDLNIDGMMFGLNHPVPPDDTWDHHFNMPLKNGVFQGSPGWVTVGTNVIASKTTGIIGAELGMFGAIAAWTQTSAPVIDLTGTTLSLSLSGWTAYLSDFGHQVANQGKGSSGIKTNYNATTTSST